MKLLRRRTKGDNQEQDIVPGPLALLSRWRLLSILISAILLVWITWTFIIGQYEIQGQGQEPAFYAGDRILVSRLSYGVRPALPFGEHIWTKGRPKIGEWMVFKNCIPGKENHKEIARCFALPGDTVWFTWDKQMILSKSNKLETSAVLPFVVPKAGKEIKIKPWNEKVVVLTLVLHEHRNARAVSDSTILLDGKEVGSVIFKQDYYWAFSGNESNYNDSRYYGFVPDENLIGRAFMISFSKSPTSFFGFRPSRTLMMLK